MRYRAKLVCAILLMAAMCVAATAKISGQAGIKTPLPPLLDKWESDLAGPNAADADVERLAEKYRPAVLRLPDPFSSLADLQCPQRLPKEKVVWEDRTAMALVDTRNRGSKLLVVPKRQVNFPIDLKPAKEQMANLARIAAATCDALVVASGKDPAASPSACTIRIGQPGELGVRQLHIHVQANTGVASPVDDTFLQRAGAHLRRLISGAGCF